LFYSSHCWVGRLNVRLAWQMASLILPETVTLRLVDPAHNPLHLANVLFVVHAFANYKNDFDLAPFASNVAGVVRISRQELLAEAQAHYDSGLMDYAPWRNANRKLKYGHWNRTRSRKL
jgi:hypothetical protein